MAKEFKIKKGVVNGNKYMAGHNINDVIVTTDKPFVMANISGCLAATYKEKAAAKNKEATASVRKVEESFEKFQKSKKRNRFWERKCSAFKRLSFMPGFMSGIWLVITNYLANGSTLPPVGIYVLAIIGGIATGRLSYECGGFIHAIIMDRMDRKLSESLDDLHQAEERTNRLSAEAEKYMSLFRQENWRSQKRDLQF